MPNPHDVLGPTVLDYEAWRDLLRSMCGRYYSEGIEPNAFAGWVRPVTTRGLTALDIGCNAHQVERTYRDFRLDGADHYFTLFQASGQSAMIHKDQAVRLAVGDVALVDAARPVTYCADNGSEPWTTVSLSLPRQSLVRTVIRAPRAASARSLSRFGLCASPARHSHTQSSPR
jgi:AraC family transcriptional regulator, positive regulator of tynA and feaB